MQDTLKTVGVGMGGTWVTFVNLFPEIVSLLVAIATLVYMCIKIVKELK
mgnify:CR=1 FL=1|tara:strand:- start:67 stop:213 length:147 start_codon:yes stop_codon:yes gene_type:complete